MAAATLSSSAIDFKSPASFPIRLGNSISKPAESKKYTSVRYNHKPCFRQPKSATYTLEAAKENGQIGRGGLVLRDDRDMYNYEGRNISNGDYYVLISTGNGKGREMILERLEGCHDFDLKRSSAKALPQKLVAEFPKLSMNENKPEDGLFGDEEDSEEPLDPSNPWDFRNYLDTNLSKPVEREIPVQRPTTASPALQPKAANTTPMSRPATKSSGPLLAQRKRKATDTSKPNPKRVKAGTEPPTPVSTRPRAATDLPKVKIDRKASIRRASYDDSGELILENETPISEKPPKQQSAMSLALSGQLGQGPISLHSAASSPASRIASPMPSRPEGMEEGEEFEFGESSSPEAPVKQQGRNEEADDEGDDEDADADVEDFELPSPAQVNRKSVSAATITGGDDDDDLDKQLALAMAEEDDGSVQGAPPADESDEESEAE